MAVGIPESDKHQLHTPADLDRLLEAIGNARIVMLGEASHGTHEYYTWRMALSRRLIEEKGFRFIAVEGDWPDCYRVNRFIKGYVNSGTIAEDVISQFERWPSWMWSNWEMVAFADWLKRYNTPMEPEMRTGFYGLDVYSLWESLDAVMDFLENHDPAAAELAQKTLSCLEPFRDDEGGIAYAKAQRWMPTNCEKEVIALLRSLRTRNNNYKDDPESTFSAEQNARIAVNAEKYYRIMTTPGHYSWNLRDEHMMTTLNNLMDFHGKQSKAIVWAHNTHIGDARYTDMSKAGLFNIGQLARQQWGNEAVFLVGFGCYQGTVTAGQYWGAPMESMQLPPARENSWEHLLNIAGDDFYLLSKDLRESTEFQRPVLHRAVGVVYHPETEHNTNYVPSLLPQRYDAFAFISNSRSLHAIPNHIKNLEAPDTYPWNF